MTSARTQELGAPFAVEEVRFHAVEVDAEGRHARLEAHLAPEALRRRFDAVVGVSGWSLRYRPWGDAALFAELGVGEVVKSAVVRVPPGTDPELAAAAAWSAAAELFGARPPLRAASEAWVELDPEHGEPLHPPETVDAAAPEADAAPLAADADVAAAGDEAEATDEPGKDEAQRVIDRLVERLRREGLGARAAKLVNEYGGYGRTVEESRALYTRLRALLMEEGGGA